MLSHTYQPLPSYSTIIHLQMLQYRVHSRIHKLHRRNYPRGIAFLDTRSYKCYVRCRGSRAPLVTENESFVTCMLFINV